jgi:hypothetical protein
MKRQQSQSKGMLTAYSRINSPPPMSQPATAFVKRGAKEKKVILNPNLDDRAERL